MTVGKWLIDLQKRSSGVALKYKSDDQWREVSWPEYLNKVISLWIQLQKLEINAGDHVGILSSTRWEWVIADMALVGTGIISVPLYANQSDEDLLFIINHSAISLLIIEDDVYQKQIDRIKSQFSKNVLINSFADFNFEKSISKTHRQDFFTACKKVKFTDIATIVYTSGTTGIPKGVVLLHEAIISEVEEIFKLIGVKSEYTSLTFLPYAHVMGRVEMWGNCYNGHTLAFAESIDLLKKNLLEIQPDFMIAVPRIFEKVYAGIMTSVEAQPLKQKLFNQAIAVSAEIAKYRETKQTIPWDLLLQQETICRVAFAPIKKAFGGKLLFALSGGAPLAPELGNFFSYCGIQVLEGYGLTETCAAITVNTPYNFHPGTVGNPIGEVQIKIANDGEILVKSKKCFKEYYKNPQATAEVFNDGYFATGDIGEFTATGQLRITDRKKDLIKTANGKYVAPQKLEGLLKQEPLISQVLIHGDQKKFISALICVEESAVRSWGESQNLPTEDIQNLIQNPAFHLRIQKQIQRTNANLAAHESIKKFEIVSDVWSIENGSLTPSLKVKRKFLEKKYATLIEEMYE
ncbi:MAG: hypothetical protein A2622_02750 [Bdellovibrionales bacterium RIFCSPHIGHO2_01_FULL_40_29]|nr:MAG: hypothetical protein A2622_02750 [Bdellovibrionales bacterium RIFCSPHIGHO2_01_FULL_40_29]OFZ33997.1 MAG: hypothetical protein A3D17_03170 [Bdellovibrionales bacterium RIFCSPHIGHO2_02_FULL_40_15]